MTTGETANGRSMIPFRIALPRNLCRTSTSAQAIPKTVFSGTAIPAIMIVSQNACSASGVVTESIAWAMPSSNALKKIRTTGISRSANR